MKIISFWIFRCASISRRFGTASHTRRLESTLWFLSSRCNFHCTSKRLKGLSKHNRNFVFQIIQLHVSIPVMIFMKLLHKNCTLKTNCSLKSRTVKTQQ